MTHSYDTTRPHVTLALSYPEAQQLGPFSVEPGPFPVMWTEGDCAIDAPWHDGPVDMAGDLPLCVRHSTERGYTPPMPVVADHTTLPATHVLAYVLSDHPEDGPYEHAMAYLPTGAWVEGADEDSRFPVACESCGAFGVPLMTDVSPEPTRGIAMCGACHLREVAEGEPFASITLRRL